MCKKKKKGGKQMFVTISEECDENGAIFSKEIKWNERNFGLN